MAKKLISLFLSLFILVTACFPVFAAGSENEPIEGSFEWLVYQIIDVIQNGSDPGSLITWYLKSVFDGQHTVDLVCPNGDYEAAYSGVTTATCPYDGEALIIKTDDYTFTPAKNTVSENGDYNLPGYVNDKGIPAVTKDGKAVYAALPRVEYIKKFNKNTNDYGITPLYEDFHHEVSYNGYDRIYDTKWIDNTHCRFTYYITNLSSSYSYNNSFWIDYEIVGRLPGKYTYFSELPEQGTWEWLYTFVTDFDGFSRGTFAHSLSTGGFETLPNNYIHTYDGNIYTPYRVALDCFNPADFKSDTISFTINPLWLAYEPVDTNLNRIILRDNPSVNGGTFKGKIYEDTDTKLVYVYPDVPSAGGDGDTVSVVPDHPFVYNPESKNIYIYDETTNNYYYINSEVAPSPSPTPSPSPSPSPSPFPSPSPAPTETPSPDVTPTHSPTVKPSTPETGDKGECCDHTGIIALLEEIRDKMVAGFADFTANFNTVIADFQTVVVAGFTDITNNITAVITDFKAAVVAGFADISANFTLAIENLNVNIQNIINKKFEDLPEPSPSPSPDPDQPSPSPEPVDPIIPETQNLIIPKMNSNTFADEHGTWIASGSSKYSDVFDFFYAFDRSTYNFWETNAKPSYLQIEIPDPESYYIDGYIMRISKFNNRYAKDWTLQGSDDGKTWDDLDKQTGQNLSDMEEHKYPLTLRKAYKYYRLNMSNYASSMCSLSHFNLLGYDAKDVVTPTPAPTEPPSPTPSPSPAPTGKPDGGGDTNNFWNIFICGGSDDGTDGDHKGIFWALVSLILALIAFFTNLFAGVAYLFPFLPEGVVMTINTCLFVVFLFVIIKFIMRSK